MMNDQDEFQVVSSAALADMAREALHAERKRVHLLLHDGHGDQVQRLIIVLQVGSYVRPHHHPDQWEMLILLQGRGELLRFSPDGKIIDRTEMTVSVPVVQIPQGVWHGFRVIEPGTAVMEVKPGPYRPSEFAEWAPAEADRRVPHYLRQLAAG
jgi:cupin fold WbuC family metalloprotein